MNLTLVKLAFVGGLAVGTVGPRVAKKKLQQAKEQVRKARERRKEQR